MPSSTLPVPLGQRPGVPVVRSRRVAVLTIVADAEQLMVVSRMVTDGIEQLLRNAASVAGPARLACSHTRDRANWKSRLAVVAASGSTARCSATTLITPSLRSRRPRISIAGALRATLRNRAQHPFDTTTLISPVSSSRLRNVTPWAVIGRWRWVTTPATITLLRGSHSHKPCRRHHPQPRQFARAGTSSGGRRVTHRWPTGRRPTPRSASSPAAWAAARR